MKSHDDPLLRECLAPVRQIEAEPTDIDAIIRRADLEGGRGNRRRSRLRASAMAIAVAVGLLIVPPVRAAVEDVASNFASYLSGDDSGSEPGRALSQSEIDQAASLPPWISGSSATDQRVLASNGGHSLFISRDSGGEIFVTSDGGFAIAQTPESWAKEFSGTALVVLGPVEQEARTDATPLYGLSSSDVTKVDVIYEDGGSVSADARTGGFVALVDPSKRPTSIEAYSAGSEVIEESDVSYITWSNYTETE